MFLGIPGIADILFFVSLRREFDLFISFYGTNIQIYIMQLRASEEIFIFMVCAVRHLPGECRLVHKHQRIPWMLTSTGVAVRCFSLSGCSFQGICRSRIDFFAFCTIESFDSKPSNHPMDYNRGSPRQA